MKKILAIFLAVLLCFSLTSCMDLEETKEAPANVQPVQEPSKQAQTTEIPVKQAQQEKDGSWAIYWYLCGSNLESDNGCATMDLMEALQVTLPENVTVVIETGGAREWKAEGFSADRLQRWVMQKNSLVLVDETELANMGDPQTLEDFLTFAYANYPADKIAVTFWNHGGGSTSGAAFDELYGNDYLSLVEMYQAFSKVWEPNAEDQPLELVGFDTCLMATIDTAYVFCDLARYLVASEELEPGNGWNYTGWLGALAQNPAMNGAELGKAICDSFYEGCKQIGTEAEITLSVTDLSKVGGLISAYERFGDEALVSATQNQNFIASFARAAIKSENYGGNTKEQGYSNMLDIGHLARITKDFMPSAEEVLQELDNCIVYKIAGPYRSEATGLSGYYSYDGSISNLNGYIQNGAGKSFKYLYAYELTGELVEGGEEYIRSLDIQEMPQLLSLADTDWDGKKLGLTDDGYSVLDLGEQAEAILSDIQFALYYTDVDNDTLLFLGCDNDILCDWDNGVFNDNFRGVWPALNGTPLYMELLFAGDEYNLYSSPILLNGEQYSLQFSYDFDLEEWTILGATKGIDEETGMGSKEMRLLEAGDEISIIWKMSTFDDDSEMEMYKVADFTFDESLTLDESPLPDGSYAMVFMMWDAFGNDAVSESAMFDVSNGEILTTVLD